MSKPTASMCPLCSPPRRLPAPLNLEVERRDAEAAAEIAELANGGEPFLRHLRQRVFRRNQEVGVGAAIRSSDAAAKLVQLRQAIAICAIDDDRVRVRDVETVLDDRRREEHIVLVRDEIDHDPLELVFTHLAMTDSDLGFGHEPRDQIAEGVDRLDAVVNEVDLAAAFHLRKNRPRDDGLVELDDVGLDRQAIARWRLDDRHVADAGQRHVQRPRNRRRRHRQDVDFLAHLFDALFVGNAESLFLVDDEQPEIAELDVLGKDSVRADEDFHLAGGEIVDRLFLLRFRPEAAQHVDTDGKCRETILQRLDVLKREDCRRCEERRPACRP